MTMALRKSDGYKKLCEVRCRGGLVDLTISPIRHLSAYQTLGIFRVMPNNSLYMELHICNFSKKQVSPI